MRNLFTLEYCIKTNQNLFLNIAYNYHKIKFWSLSVLGVFMYRQKLSYGLKLQICNKFLFY